MSRPTMDEMRERDAAAREAVAPKVWLVDIEARATFKRTVEVKAADEEEAKAAAEEEADYMGLCVGDGDYDECEYDETDYFVRRKEVEGAEDTETPAG